MGWVSEIAAAFIHCGVILTTTVAYLYMQRKYDEDSKHKSQQLADIENQCFELRTEINNLKLEVIAAKDTSVQVLTRINELDDNDSSMADTIPEAQASDHGNSLIMVPDGFTLSYKEHEPDLKNQAIVLAALHKE